MKYIYNTILLLLFGINLIGQNVTFSYTVTELSATERKLDIFANLAPGMPSESITGFTTKMYFDNNLTSYTSTDLTPLNSFGTPFFSATEVNSPNPGLPFNTNTGYIEVGGFFLVGSANINAGTTMQLFSLNFTNSNSPSIIDNAAFFVSTANGDPAVGYGITGNADLDLVTSGEQQQILPITLSSFTANKLEEVSSKLDWTTSQEVNGSHFEIERSDDAQNWTQIGSVNAIGESTEEEHYSYIDQNVGLLRSNGTFYYRLKMVDLDGQYEYSEIRSVTFNTVGSFEVEAHPNPVRNTLFVDVKSKNASENDKGQLLLMDVSGKILLKKSIFINGYCEIDLNNVSSSIILMKVTHNDNVYTKKIIKVD